MSQYIRIKSSHEILQRPYNEIASMQSLSNTRKFKTQTEIEQHSTLTTRKQLRDSNDHKCYK